MKIKICISGIYGGGFSSCSLHMSGLRTLSLATLRDEFCLGDVPLSFWLPVKCTPDECIRVGTHPNRRIVLLPLFAKAEKPSIWRRGDDPRLLSCRARFLNTPKMFRPNEVGWDMECEEALAHCRILAPGLNAWVEDCGGHRGVVTDASYEELEGIGVSLPRHVEGQLDVNRFLIVGVTKFGFVAPTNIITSPVEAGLWGDANGSIGVGKDEIRLCNPAADAGRPDEVEEPTHGATVIYQAGTAFDIA